jgi:hypothetical protein
MARAAGCLQVWEPSRYDATEAPNGLTPSSQIPIHPFLLAVSAQYAIIESELSSCSVIGVSSEGNWPEIDMVKEPMRHPFISSVSYIGGNLCHVLANECCNGSLPKKIRNCL